MQRTRLRSIQSLRAVAACAVLFSHAFSVQGGRFGVDLFFVISGYIIGCLHKKRETFLQARLLRVFPMYWISAVPWLIAKPWTWSTVLSTLTLWPMWQEHFVFPLMPVAWTLSFELLFYMSVTTSLFIGRFIPVIAFFASLAWFMMTGDPRASWIGNPMIIEFLAGLLLTKAPTSEKLAPYLLGAGLVLWPGLFGTYGFAPSGLLDPVMMLARIMTWGVAAILLVWGALCCERLFSGRWSEPLVALGDASYSLYLVHMLIVEGLPALSGWLMVVCSIAVAMIVHRKLEAPLLSAGARYLRRTHMAAPA